MKEPGMTIEEWQEYLLQLHQSKKDIQTKTFVNYDQNDDLICIRYKLSNNDFKRINDEIYRVNAYISTLKNKADLSEIPKLS